MSDRKQENILTVVSELRKSVDDMKNSQKTGGASFVNYPTHSNDQYDLAFSQSITRKTFRVRFNHAETGKLHLLRLSAFFRLNNPDVMGAPYLTNISRVAQLDLIPEPPTSDHNDWLINFTNLNTPTNYAVYVKLFFKGTTPGDFIITPL